MKQFDRFISQIGKENFEKIITKKMMIFGIGGVGGYVSESLARSGIQNFVLIDSDIVEETNINRQIVATLNTIDESKVKVMKDRILSINKNANVEIIKTNDTRLNNRNDMQNYFDNINSGYYDRVIGGFDDEKIDMTIYEKKETKEEIMESEKKSTRKLEKSFRKNIN